MRDKDWFQRRIVEWCKFFISYRDRMIQAIVYDAVGTLIHVLPNVAAIYAEIGARFGSRLDADAIQRRFHAAFARQDQLDQQAAWRTSEAREADRWRAIIADVLDDIADPAGCFAALFERFGQPDAWSCAADASELLATFHRRGIRQALASNFDRRLRGVIAPMAIAPYLDPLTVSSEIGWRKPAPEFFRHVAESLEVPPSAILFVGDDRGNDFEAARAAGMRALLLDPRRRHLDVEADRIEQLGELLNAIDRFATPRER